jgi:hypothetical protein
LDHIISLGIGLTLSIAAALFFSFKAGQAVGRISNVESLHEISLNKLKQKTVNKLKILFSEYQERHEHVHLPEEMNFNDIVERMVLINDDNIKEQILGLNQIYLDLITNGTGSTYFVHILDVYGQIGAF